MSINERCDDGVKNEKIKGVEVEMGRVMNEAKPEKGV